MVDIKLNRDGDIDVSEIGDISLTESVRQAVLMRLRWIYGEWRLGPEMGFKWFEEVFVKNPNTGKIRQLIRDEIMQVDGVTGATVETAEYSAAARTTRIAYTVTVGEETYREEVTMNG